MTTTFICQACTRRFVSDGTQGDPTACPSCGGRLQPEGIAGDYGPALSGPTPMAGAVPPVRAINFVVTPARYRAETGTEPPATGQLVRSHPVRLDALTPDARRVALSITETTGRPGQEVRLRSHQTQAELSAGQPAATAAAAQTDRAGSPRGREHPTVCWMWAPLDMGEDPTAYLEQQVEAMKLVGSIEHVGSETDTLTTAEAAARMGVSPRRMRHLCNTGRVPGARKSPWGWQIPASNLARIQVRPGPGRPWPTQVPNLDQTQPAAGRE